MISSDQPRDPRRMVEDAYSEGIPPAPYACTICGYPCERCRTTAHLDAWAEDLTAQQAEIIRERAELEQARAAAYREAQALRQRVAGLAVGLLILIMAITWLSSRLLLWGVTGR